MPTIKDIARAAGVSHGTVSNVLNKTGKVNAQKIRLVEEAAKKLGYVPNSQAQLLRQGAGNQVAVIIPDLQDSRYSSLFSAIQSRLFAIGLDVAVYDTGDIGSSEEQILSKLRLSNLTGVVTVSGLGEKAAAAYERFSCPVVAVNRSLLLEKENHTLIQFDHYKAGHDIGERVLKNRWKRVAFFCVSGRQEDENTLFSGLNEALENASVSIEKFSADTKLAINKSFDILRKDHAFDCIICTGYPRAEAIDSALSFTSPTARPQIICVGTAKIFPLPYFIAYEMDYGQMGAQIANYLAQYIRNKERIPKRVMLENKGFPFSFSTGKKGTLRELRMLTLESPATLALEKIIPRFEMATGISLKITSLPLGDLYEHLGLINEKFYYDLVRMDTAWLSNLGNEIYLPLDETGVDEKRIRNQLTSVMPDNYYLSGGVPCALPFDPSVQIFLYRSDLFQDATLCRLYFEKYREPLAVPTTIAQYARVAEFFTKQFNPDSPTNYGTTITGGSALTAACDFLPYYLAGGHSIVDEQGRVWFDTPEMRAALCQYLQMKKYTHAEENLWWRDSVRQFADGDTATAHTFSNHAAYLINSKQSNVVGKTGVAIMPGGHPLLGGGVIGICRYSREPEASKQFLEWFYTKDVASAMVRLGGTSPLVDGYNDYENFSVFPWLPAEKQSFAIGTRGDTHQAVAGFSNRHYDYALGTAVRNMLNGMIGPEAAAAFAQTIYDSKVLPNISGDERG